MANGGDPSKQKSFVVDLLAIKSLFEKPWDQTQHKNLKLMSYMRGVKEAKKWAGKDPMIIVFLAVGAMFGLGILLVVVTHLFG